MLICRSCGQVCYEEDVEYYKDDSCDWKGYFCPNCHAENELEDAYTCPICGRPITYDEGICAECAKTHDKEDYFNCKLELYSI